MRNLIGRERAELLALPSTTTGPFHGPTLDDLEDQRRVERHDVGPDGSYRLRVTDLGHQALRLPRVSA